MADPITLLSITSRWQTLAETGVVEIQFYVLQAGLSEDVLAEKAAIAFREVMEEDTTGYQMTSIRYDWPHDSILIP